ncbi:3-dehydroquinate synthase [Dermabacter sp. p3-SID358]|uniref:3-dehydroquinate synthase n=1 Tax=Dermabacter sp. p3-SID358 TaxID=2916114 RepID=UPI0021A557C4|nr:3-dehydroquinate synthase [Dermabacter sp. p3-SID358]MCT1866120.1 3-dehydroquinate synthase [Dermabacter sp. p3-SID358]
MTTHKFVSTTRITVGAGVKAYEVTVGRSLAGAIVSAVPAHVLRVLVVYQEPVEQLARELTMALESDGRKAFRVAIPDAEQAKGIDTLAELWRVLGTNDFTRSDLIIGVGGGAATDLAGFAAATWLRGIDVIHVPTTVAGMVDAAVGGKTGINTAEGKNLVGAFHEPLAVFADLDALDALPAHDVSAGLAEVVKAGFIADERILEIIEHEPRRVRNTRTPEFEEIMTRAIRIKADVVSDDLTEKGRREILNYGHTLGHAIERHEQYTWRHGDAVAVGMVFAAELSHRTGHLSLGLLERHRSILESLSLPTCYREGQFGALREAMARDKKARGEMLRFVILEAVGTPIRLEGPEEQLLEESYRAIAA